VPDPVGQVRWEVTAMDVSRRHRRALVSLWLLLLLGGGAAILGIRPDDDYDRSRALRPQDPTVVLGLVRRTLVVLEPGTHNRAAVTAMVKAHLPMAAVPRTGLIRYIHV